MTQIRYDNTIIHVVPCNLEQKSYTVNKVPPKYAVGLSVMYMKGPIREVLTFMASIRNIFINIY